jgi:E3 ubiquitin-protein ligase EDD1
MQAVCARAYPAAILLLDTAKHIATKDKGQVDKEMFLSMLCPAGSGLDNSPLQVVCCNDTCSFTWTGDEHINQVY